MEDLSDIKITQRDLLKAGAASATGIALPAAAQDTAASGSQVAQTATRSPRLRGARHEALHAIAQHAGLDPRQAVF
ncbi:hypothetical protein Tamer19_49760 [Cupriavidus sp. TA19]|uniref:hypothetical protein n=1 Tax=unclassified Cupriavidus TaxID=2640874 RepID=UPI000E2FB09F|nr:MULTISPECIES: hypothetical protein [unclassified Cupriavidus]BDB27580.1 hypothetical protein CTP10_R49880 [Cupriavidus sp. P-10]GLC95567.1 hypothetical protein Tamer19_49760 [Cupriavidus sp. TA19]